jgi:hypothetical protein
VRKSNLSLLFFYDKRKRDLRDAKNVRLVC